MSEPIEVLKVKELKALTGASVQKKARFFRNHTYVSMEKLPGPNSDLTECTLTCRGCAINCVIRFLIPGEPLYAFVGECGKAFCSLCRKLDEIPVVYNADVVPDGLSPRTSDANEES